MVHLVLSNNNIRSKCRSITFNTDTSLFLLEDNQQLKKQALINIGFEHPLLVQPEILPLNGIYHYQYEDIEGLFESTRYVYSVLLQASEPSNCRFNIHPSANFIDSNTKGQIYCSIKGNQPANEAINMEDFEGLISELSGYNFKFINYILIKDSFNTKDLPNSIDGDLLFETKKELVNLLKQPCDLDRFELRYLDPVVRFGLFTRDFIRKDEILFPYSGEKRIFDSKRKGYAFECHADCLNMHMDASRYGNISRFVNHAPESKNGSDSRLLDANLKTISHHLNGIEVIFFKATRDILIGEQLLANYGENSFKSSPMARFTSKGKVIYKNRFGLWKKSQNKIAHIKIMANHGLKKAQRYLLLRLFLICIVLLIMVSSV